MLLVAFGFIIAVFIDIPTFGSFSYYRKLKYQTNIQTPNFEQHHEYLWFYQLQKKTCVDIIIIFLQIQIDWPLQQNWHFHNIVQYFSHRFSNIFFSSPSKYKLTYWSPIECDLIKTHWTITPLCHPFWLYIGILVPVER